MMERNLLILGCGCLMLLLGYPQTGSADADFAGSVRPILTQHCVRCHGPKKQEGGLRLDVKRRALQGGDAGAVIVPGVPERSALIKRVTADGNKRMPPNGKPLTEAEVNSLRVWIAEGARWPDDFAGREEHEDHWSFRPIVRPVASNHHTPIDGLVRERLKKEGLVPSPEADRHTLIRRLYLDLLGLPPTPADVEAFVQETATDYYGRLVERLLASPHFGERWGRHWLDLARFAESDGFENDRIRKDAWRYRDWVIDAINRDLPFTQFTIDQLAGDLLPNATIEQKIATGFHRNTLYNSAASGDKEEFRTLAVKDRADTTATVWLGLTLGCAKCHSHKYDPVSIREYYQLYAFFNSTDNLNQAVPGGQAQTLRVVDRPTNIHNRGNFLQKGEAVKPGTPRFLPSMQPRGQTPDRLDLARWLVDSKNPLTARVAANHVWQHLFGRGLVPTPENFGTNGEPPTHPELLDWLATELVRQNWSRKALVRAIVLSATYKQSSGQRPELLEPDPNNRFLARQNRLRVEAEVVRDQALAVSELLTRQLGGPSIVPPFPDGLLDHKFTSEGLKMPGGDRHRRGIYIHVQRTLAFPALAAFDFADSNQTCVRREPSVTPIQALTLLNDPTFVECAQALGTRMVKAVPNRDGRLRLGFQLCLGRPPDQHELGVLVNLVLEQERLGAKEDAVWIGVARTLLNLDLAITRE